MKLKKSFGEVVTARPALANPTLTQASKQTHTKSILSYLSEVFAHANEHVYLFSMEFKKKAKPLL